MNTTIQIEKETKQMLDEIKRREGAATYNEIILRILKRKSSPPKSMYGALGKAKNMKEILKGLRDEND